MSRSKFQTVSGMEFGTQFISEFLKKMKELGATEEMIYTALKSKSNFIPQMAEKIAEMIAGVPKRVLKYLKLAEENVKISSPSFSKAKFFGSEYGVKIWMGDNFKSWILPEILETVPAFEGNFSSFDFTKSMYDSEIREEIGEGTITPDEWLAKTRVLILEQPKGEQGHLISNGYANIDYIRLKSGKVVAVAADWNSGSREWYLHAYDLDGDRWSDGGRVFSRS